MTDKEGIANIRWEEDNPNEPEFDIDLRTRIVDHPVFDAGHALQWQLEKTVVAGSQFEEALDQATPYIEALNTQVSQEGLLGIRAGVRGRDIVLPEIEMDFARGVMTIQPLSDAARADELAKTFLDTDAIRGHFAGYSLRFRKNPELPDAYIPQLIYQISLRELGRQHAYVMPLATGDVGVSELFFEADERLDARREILERLFACVGDHGIVADKINRVLAEATKFDAGVLRSVGLDADRLISLMHGTERQQAEDALTDLIGNYIVLPLTTSVTASKIVRVPLDVTTRIYEHIEDMQTLDAAPTSIDFIDLPVKHTDGTVGSRRACSLIFDQQDHMVVMPLVKVERFI